MSMVMYVPKELTTRNDLIDALNRGEDVYVYSLDGEGKTYTGTVSIESDPENHYLWWADVVIENNRIKEIQS